ncbi:4Fe-4S dicluster domain-containing protein [Desulfoluna spongiiphila]|uniref:Prokaryotic molybdopterin-containing oxidoreductase family, iron-sulfur binding subunit n=1 Tax=Desulfoluna spongiiphila TaxID=419481 RepID=A0A1G5ESC7_9BACT|nr:4Fe-4S dicluster domain-containing protein [Desulfoluna spongiiphila]SCY29560.1 prokaryotic molybdopterin-containing oxidoreductase family, iron-sulfur binding subunit [Desulfoluna spongiiphila]VVS91293.1 4fe-4s ferredoxin-type iron-sulphur binding domain [Desulfoluna spongiiphila]
MPQYAMVIDLQRCVGCGGCSVACRNENNVPDGIYWSNKITETVGTFPDVRFHYLPTLCNHCENAPCVRGCPTGAMHKLSNGITMHDPDKCIGCKYCEFNCPYGVIYFNWRSPHPSWRDAEPLIEGCTFSPSEVTQKAGGKAIPYYNPDREETLPGIRPKGVVEKCTFCDHRVEKNLLPYCVEACPADARIFGDISDPKSKVSKLLGKFRPFRLREHLGTNPRVFYIRGYNPAHYEASKGGYK